MADPAREAFWREMERGYALSPMHQTIGLTLTIPGDGEALVTLEGNPKVSNRNAVVAGGALATMIDSACMQACRSLLDPGDGFATLELSVTYVRPGAEGVRLVARGTSDHVGRTILVAHARVEDEEGRLVALGHATGSVRRAAASGARSS